MFTIDFYETASGYSDILDFLTTLEEKKKTDKDARVQYQQLAYYIQLLQDNGTQLPRNIVKPLTDGIWELRPGNNRVFFFFFQNDTYVLLHHIRKKSQKTPRKEIEKAKNERDDYIARKEPPQ